jgi:nucleotide-binding universal stress UspA family protein
MKAVIWINEGTWEACVEQARELLPGETEVTLLHVNPGDVEELAGGPRLLGRHPPRPPGPPLRTIAAEEAEAMLDSAQELLGRPAKRISTTGQIEREVLATCADADVLVVARGGAVDAGPKSLGPRSRFVVDHAPCQVLLVWPERPGG